MSKKIFAALTEVEEKLQEQKYDTDDKLDQVQVLSLIADSNDHFFITNNVISGTISDIVELSHASIFEKLVSLIPKGNFLHDIIVSKSSGQGIEWSKQEESYYILLDEKTLMQLSLIVERKTATPTTYMFKVETRRGNGPLTMSGVKIGNANHIMIYDDDISLFKVNTEKKEYKYKKEPAINVLSLTNLEDTFISKLTQSLGIEIGEQRRQ